MLHEDRVHASGDLQLPLEERQRDEDRSDGGLPRQQRELAHARGPERTHLGHADPRAGIVASSLQGRRAGRPKDRWREERARRRRRRSTPHASRSLTAASRPDRTTGATPWNVQKVSSTPYTCTPAAMRPVAAWVTVPATAMRLVVWPTVSGAATAMAARQTAVEAGRGADSDVGRPQALQREVAQARAHRRADQQGARQHCDRHGHAGGNQQVKVTIVPERGARQRHRVPQLHVLSGLRPRASCSALPPWTIARSNLAASAAL